MQYSQMSNDELRARKAELDKDFAEIKKLNLKLDMSRGKPGADQLDLSMDMLKTVIGVCDCKAENGFDCRNYGVLDGLPECKALFAEMLEVSPDNIIIRKSDGTAVLLDFGAEFHGTLRITTELVNGAVQTVNVRVRFGE